MCSGCSGLSSTRPGWRASRCRSRPSRRMSIPSVRMITRPCPGARRSSGGSRASCAGTPWRWSFGPTVCRTGSAGTSPPTPRPPRCTRWASTTSSAAARTTATPTSFTSRGMPRRGSTPARFSKAACRSRSCRTSGANWQRAGGCLRIRTPGSCPTSGSSRRSRWGSGPSCRSTRRASTGTSKTGA